MLVNCRPTNSRRDPAHKGRLSVMLSVSVSAAVAGCHGSISCSIRPHHRHVRFSIKRLRDDLLQFFCLRQQTTGEPLHLLQRLKIKS